MLVHFHNVQTVLKNLQTRMFHNQNCYLSIKNISEDFYVRKTDFKRWSDWLHALPTAQSD